MEDFLRNTLCELIARASTDLPDDVEQSLRQARDAEQTGSNARRALDTILSNIALARKTRRPLCQDTGALLFWVRAPLSLRQPEFRRAAETAIAAATSDGFLRPNSVDSLTGVNSGNNLGPGAPRIHWEEDAARDTLRVALVLKGGGCENVGVQYALPDSRLNAGRDVDGVRRCCLDAVHRAQGRGCAPGVLGVCVGGDRGSGIDESKRQFLGRIGERSVVPEVAALEERILAEANSLGVGAMGFGGRTSLLDVRIGFLNRLPASYFVSVSYMCWAFRRRFVEVALDGEAIVWE